MEFGIMLSENDNFFYVINLNDGSKVERLAYWFIQLTANQRLIALDTVGMTCERHAHLMKMNTIRKSRPQAETTLNKAWGKLAKSTSELKNENARHAMRPVLNEARQAMNECKEAKALGIIKRATRQVINLHIRYKTYDRK